MDVGADHSGVSDVSDDRYVHAVKAAEALANGEGIEEGLGGMLMRAVAGVDDRRRQPVGQHLRRAGILVADDDHVGMHGHQVLRGVDQGLPFFHRGAGDGEVERVGRQALLGDLERDSRARRGLHEEVDDQLSAQRRNLFYRPFADFLEAFSGVENEGDFFGSECLDAEKVFAS